MSLSKIAFQGRTGTDITSFNTNETGITAPHWVKLERDAAANSTASRSTNGTTWQPIGSAFLENIPMDGTIHVGLGPTSHDAAQTCEAVFSNVTISGNVGAQWAHQDVGILNNSAEPFYVALSNATFEEHRAPSRDANYIPWSAGITRMRGIATWSGCSSMKRMARLMSAGRTGALI